MSDIAKQGYVKVQSKKLGVWKKRWLILRRKSGHGQARIEKYKDESSSFDFDQTVKATVLELRYIDGVQRTEESYKKYGVVVVDQTKNFYFAPDSELEANAWMEAIKEEVENCKKTQNSYKVYAMKNAKLNFSGDCYLFVSDDAVKLLDLHSRREMVSWLFSSLRRYGVERNMFTLESGRSSSTGEGVFFFDAEDAEAVYNCVHDATQRLARSGANRNNTASNTGATRNTSAGNSFNNYGPTVRSTPDPPPYSRVDAMSISDGGRSRRNERSPSLGSDYSLGRDFGDTASVCSSNKSDYTYTDFCVSGSGGSVRSDRSDRRAGENDYGASTYNGSIKSTTSYASTSSNNSRRKPLPQPGN